MAEISHGGVLVLEQTLEFASDIRAEAISRQNLDVVKAANELTDALTTSVLSCLRYGTLNQLLVEVSPSGLLGILDRVIAKKWRREQNPTEIVNPGGNPRIALVTSPLKIAGLLYQVCEYRPAGERLSETTSARVIGASHRLGTRLPIGATRLSLAQNP